MSEHEEKTHPVSGLIFALVLTGIVFLLVAALAGGNNKGLFAMPFLLLASLYAVFGLGPNKDAAHDHAPSTDH